MRKRGMIINEATTQITIVLLRVLQRNRISRLWVVVGERK